MIYTTQRRRFVYDTWDNGSRLDRIMVECTLSITHCLRLNLQLHAIDFVRTCRIGSFCTVAWQLARFQLTRRIVRSLGDSWASCFSVFWRCWLGGRKGIRPVKKWVVGWLSVWSEVQTCIWPSGCHCHSLSLASVKSRLVYLLVPAHPGSLGQSAVKRVCVYDVQSQLQQIMSPMNIE